LLPVLVEEDEDVDGALGDEEDEESFDDDDESLDEESLDDEVDAASLLFADPLAAARLSVR
jgi:hypothetical protein